MTNQLNVKTESDLIDPNINSRNSARPISSWKLRKQEHRKSFSGIFSKPVPTEPSQTTKQEDKEIEINPSKLLYLNNNLKEQHLQAV